MLKMYYDYEPWSLLNFMFVQNPLTRIIINLGIFFSVSLIPSALQITLISNSVLNDFKDFPVLKELLNV